MPHLDAATDPPLYNDWGTGRPVVLIHGWPLDADMWEYIRCRTSSRRAIASSLMTVAAFGRSSQPATGYDYDTLADDLKAVLDGLALADATLVGFSMGGGEVVRYLARHGSAKVRSAVLIGAVPRFW